MPSGWQELAPQRIVAFDDRSDEVSVAAAGSMSDLTTVLSFRTKPGLKGFITAVRIAWDEGLDTYWNWSLRINGGIPADYNQIDVQYAAPEQDVDLPVPIPIEQLSLIELVGFSTTGPTFPLNVTGRIIVKYSEP